MHLPLAYHKHRQFQQPRLALSSPIFSAKILGVICFEPSLALSLCVSLRRSAILSLSENTRMMSLANLSRDALSLLANLDICCPASESSMSWVNRDISYLCLKPSSKSLMLPKNISSTAYVDAGFTFTCASSSSL